MRTCVVGCGALGGMIAGRLALASVDITVVDRGERLQALAADGLHLFHPSGEESHITGFPAVSLEAVKGPFDLLILATKANDIAGVASSVSDLMHRDSVIVTVQNGIPWWYFERYGGERNGRRLRILDPQTPIAPCMCPCLDYNSTRRLDLSRAVASGLATDPRESGFPCRDASARTRQDGRSQSRKAARSRPSSGRTKRPPDSGMPARPAAPAPRANRINTVSA